MERVKRRWWTWAITLLAALVIVGAVISGLFQLAVLALPSYRADLSAWITQVANRPVQIGGINLGWRGIEPRLDLDDITLFSEDGDESLTLDRLSLGFSVLRLVTGNLFPDRLEMSGLTVVLELDADGQWTIAGFTPGAAQLPQQSRDSWSRDLARFRHVVLQNCTLVFSGPRFGELDKQVRVARMEIDQTDAGFDVDGRLHLPVTHGDTVELSAEIEGAIAAPQHWRGDFELDLARLRPQGWLEGLLQPGVQIGAENLNATIDGHLEDGRVAHADLAVDSGPLVIARDGKSSGARKARLRAAVRSEARGWIADLRELRFDDQRLAHGSLRWARDAQGDELDVDADELQLGRLMPWTSVWRDTPPAVAQAARLSGTLRNLVLRLRRGKDATPRYSATARLDGLALAPDAHVGFSGLSGDLSANENGGQLRLGRVPLDLLLPSTLPEPLRFDALDAQLQWSRVSDGWKLGAPAFSWQLAGSEGSGRFELQLPQAGGSPLLDLQARFNAQDVNRLKPYMPTHWSQHLRDWLRDSLLRGRATRGDLLIRGPLADFPYVSHPTGVWKLNLDTAGVDLRFAPDWPQLDDVAARLTFTGASLAINAISAKLNGNKIDRAVARFDDFATSLLTVDAATSGEIARFYDFLRASPLHARLSGLLDQTRAAGNASVAVKLNLPLHDIKSTSVSGSVALDNVQMFYTKLDQPISGIRGTVQFDDHGVSGEGLAGRFEDLPLAVRIAARPGTHGVVMAEFPFTPNDDGIGASQFIPALIRGGLRGQSVWHAELPIQEHDTALQLSSDLRGTEVTLPEPLAKPADAALPLNVRIGGDADAPLRIGIGYGQRLAGDLAFGDDGSGHSLHLDGMALRFGGTAPKAAKGRYVVDGRAGTADLSAWIALLAGGDSAPAPAAAPAAAPTAAPGASAPAATGGGVRVDLIDLDLAHVRWQHQISGPTHLRWVPLQNGWRANLSGEGAQGVVEYAGPAPGRLIARLERLALTPQTPPAEAEAQKAAEKAAEKAGAESAAPAPVVVDAEPPLEPGRWPELDAICENLSGAGADLGRFELKTARVAGGQRIERLKVGGGIVTLDAAGQWTRSGGRSAAELRSKMTSSDVEAVLKAFDLEPNFSARSTRIDGDLKWAPSPTGLAWQAAAGRVELEAESGQVRAVKPGASRVLGLLNFYALPRRLTLNFSDVTEDALAFDRVDGHFDLGNGAALTDDLTVRGPSLRMDLHGRIGLAARDYDQRVTVYPAGISSGVTLGAALLGGPALGAIVLLAQQVLDKPLDQVTQLSYHVSGSWDNPKVEKLDARTLRATEQKGAKKK